MTTIYTTQRCFIVKESYDVIAQCLESEEQKLIELTEVNIGHFPDTTTTTTERKTLIQKQYIVEVVV